ncbi:hypothetical protein PsorP6_018203 [Peronosclerospora sorghi]|uniref:Uncharacterized protein n=1 Tax=Peronosclerospora sorghi TaxID=230839 RepID=A0ACC0WCM4_9STRA|nr:hypothetical protein PsorP6_018203 [Peronosclerospora sorghi]
METALNRFVRIPSDRKLTQTSFCTNDGEHLRFSPFLENSIIRNERREIDPIPWIDDKLISRLQTPSVLAMRRKRFGSDNWGTLTKAAIMSEDRLNGARDFINCKGESTLFFSGKPSMLDFKKAYETVARDIRFSVLEDVVPPGL